MRRSKNKRPVLIIQKGETVKDKATKMMKKEYVYMAKWLDEFGKELK